MQRSSWLHPELPAERPLVIAHRAGNELEAARHAEALGADLIETDIWHHRGRLELRHVKTMGPVPLLWDRWTLEPGWRHRLVLSELLAATRATTRLLLDLKGKDTTLAPRIVETIRATQPERQIILCGRSWAQLDPVAADGDVTIVYSVNSDDELRAVWAKLARTAHPAVSIHARYLSADLARRFHEARVTVISWPVNDFELARRLFTLGVDGFTTDNLHLLNTIARERAAALADSASPSEAGASAETVPLAPAED